MTVNKRSAIQPSIDYQAVQSSENQKYDKTCFGQRQQCHICSY